MKELKNYARQAKRRLKTNFWQQCKQSVDANAKLAKEKGLNEYQVRKNLFGQVKESLTEKPKDEFYLKVKELLDTYGEVSDAIGRLTDKAYYATLSYQERQRYTLQLSTKYLEALEKYKREKEITF